MKWSLTFAARLNILEQTGHAHFPTSSLIGNICKNSDMEWWAIFCFIRKSLNQQEKNNHYESQESFEDKNIFTIDRRFVPIFR